MENFNGRNGNSGNNYGGYNGRNGSNGNGYGSNNGKNSNGGNSYGANNGRDGYGQGGQTGNPGLPNDLFRMVTSLAARFDGKNQNDLIRAIYEEALRGKRAGTLSNTDIDNFVAILSPMLDDKKRKMLYKVAEELKRI